MQNAPAGTATADAEALDRWQPIETVVDDQLTPAPLARLAALLDHQASPWPDGLLPPLGHWLFFLPDARQSLLGDDGHPMRGDDLPPVPLPRRMWAGSRIDFLADVAVGRPATRRSKVVEVEHKSGRSGSLTFVTVRHVIEQDGTPAIVELQDLVYREASTGAEAPRAAVPCERVASAQRSVPLGPTALFRYSALTYNAHRIHYDLPYARDVEHYPGLVVHGPLQATLLIDHLLRQRPGARLARFTFRGVRPLIAGEAATLNLAEEANGIALWTTDAAGQESMRADAVLA